MGGTETWNGVVAPFSSEKALNYSRGFATAPVRAMDRILRPLVIRYYLMVVRSLCSGIRMGVEVSSFQLTGYILLSVSSVTSEPNERRIRLLHKYCRVLEISQSERFHPQGFLSWDSDDLPTGINNPISAGCPKLRSLADSTSIALPHSLKFSVRESHRFLVLQLRALESRGPKELTFQHICRCLIG